MLFDLQGRRKNVIRVIYAFLALLMGGGLVLLGIGGDASGGLLNAVGLGDDGSTSADPAFERQIDSANETLASNPNDEKALLILARVHYLAGNNAIETDEQGATTLTEDTITEYNSADDAWQKYLATNPKKVDDGVASLMVQLYASLAGTDPSATVLQQQLDSAVEAAQIVAEARPSLGTNTTLATYAYIAGDTKLAEQARKDALAAAPDSATKQQVTQQLDQAEAQGKAIAKSIAKSAPDQEQLENPLGGLGGSAAPRPRRLIQPRSERPAGLATITDPGH